MGKICFLGLADGNNYIGFSGEYPFDPDEHQRFGSGKVACKHVSVKGMYRFGVAIEKTGYK